MSSSQTSKPEGWSTIKLGLAAWIIGLTASLANLLNFHNYTKPGLEIAILLAIFVGIALVMAGIHRLAQPRLSFVIIGLFIATLVDLGAEMEGNWFIAATAVFAFFAYFHEKVLLKLTIAAFCSVLLFQTLGLLTGLGKSKATPNEAAIAQTRTPSGQKLRPIVHLVLDSYLGLEGMAVKGSNFGNLGEEQRAFYLGRDFQIFPQAYSRHVKTINSLPHIFSYGQAPLATTRRDLQSTTAPKLDYFTDLDRLGYRISAQTPSFVDLCVNQPMTQCSNYNRSNLGAVMRSDLSTTDRARVIGFTMLQLSLVSSHLAEFAQHRLNRLLGTRDRESYNRSKVFALTGLEEIASFTDDLRTLDYGEARLIHLLLPHDPYSVTANCKVLPETRWIDEHGPAPLAERDAAYANQVRCLTTRLAAMMDTLDKTQAGRDAIVLIHGDHGSRTIETVPFVGGPKLNVRDLALSYSTFFAIRIPGERAASVPGRFALDALVGDFARSNFTSGPRPQEQPAEVLTMDTDWIPRVREKLPEFTR